MILRKEVKKKGIKSVKEAEDKPYIVRFGDLKKSVFNPEGEHLGQIEDLLLDLKNKRIVFGILTFGGIFGLGEEQYAIPWEMLRYDKKGEKYILDIDKEKLINSARFDPAKQPFPYYGQWAAGIYRYWGYRPYW